MSVDESYRVESVEDVHACVGEPVPGMEAKVADHVDQYARAFIEKSPFLVLSTADADGNIDSSPKGDAPGFVLFEDERTIVVPDRPGNRLVMGHRNILSNPHVGMLFMVPGTNETVRVNGRAELTSDPELLERLKARGKPAPLALRVHVDECFFHCAKAFLRSQLWKPESWPEKRYKVSFGQMFAEQFVPEGEDTTAVAEAIDQQIEENYKTDL
jgi:PPOX class probable FMN-dependent enzyme